jgi:hypothetical protein
MIGGIKKKNVETGEEEEMLGERFNWEKAEK